MKIPYRSEIDGLRALAVIPVIFFHGGLPGFSGGFVGVDVFFVISGFLITSLLVNDLANGRFSLLKFYERRARRILPALFLVAAVCAPVAWFLFPKNQLAEFGKSMLSISVFASNFFFWKHTGYFETEAEVKPLLHTWSLAVEEQYYIVAPVLLWLLWRFRKEAVLPVLIALALISLAIAEYSARMWPDAAFFLPHTRAWELAIGAIAALAVKQPGDGARSNDILSLAGLAMIAAAIFLYDESTPFPGVYALLPTLGTALVLLYAGTGTLVNRFLSLRILVGIGLISYSAYLWHQPLFAYTRSLSIREPAAAVMIGLSIASLGLAYLSWRFVEQPFRNPSAVSRRTIYGFSAAGLAAGIALGAFIAYSDAARARVTLSGISYSELSKTIRSNRGLHKSCVEFNTGPECATGPDPVAILWGDSHAMHLADALHSSPTPLPFVQMTKSVCFPILGIAPNVAQYNVEWGKECIQHNEKVFTWLAGRPDIRYVILASPFRQIHSEKGNLTFADGTVGPNDGIAEARFRETIRRIRELGRTPVIISPTPSSGYNVGRCLTVRSILGRNLSSCDFPLQGHLREDLYRKLGTIAEETGAELILLSDLICAEGICRSHMDGTFIYRDEGHLSHDGSAKLGMLYDLSGMIVAKTQ